MQTNESNITETSNERGLPTGNLNGEGDWTKEKKSTPTKESGTQETRLTRQESRMYAALKGAPLLVSEQQFLTVREETLESLNLLNSSANALLGAMNRMVPPEDSPRAFGEFGAQAMRQLAKSICDVIQTKNSVIRQIHSIARDEI